jgi:hypothetical protein
MAAMLIADSGFTRGDNAAKPFDKPRTEKEERVEEES